MEFNGLKPYQRAEAPQPGKEMERLDRSHPIEHADQVPYSIEETAPTEVIDPSIIKVDWRRERWGRR